MKFEDHGINTWGDTYRHSISFVNTRSDPPDCVHSRKERPSMLLHYNISEDAIMHMDDAAVSPVDKLEIQNYNAQGEKWV